MPADNVFKKFACDTGKGYRSVIYCLQLAAFLKIGATLAHVQSTGKSPVSNDCSNIKRNTGASSFARLWSNLPGIPSGPEDLLVFIPSINL